MRRFKFLIALTIFIFGYDYSNINPLLEATVTTAKKSNIYLNRAHNFKLKIPEVFNSTPQKQDSNFALFKSKDQEAELFIAFKQDKRGLKTIYNNIIANLRSKSNIDFGYYKYFGKWYVVSILDKNRDTISYQKGYKKNGTHIFYILSYPKYQKDKFDSIIKDLNKNFGYTKKSNRKTTTIKGGTWCDKYYRTCSLECFDSVNEDSCLSRCDQKLSRCYKTGKFR